MPENPKVNNAGHPKNLKTEHARLKNTHRKTKKLQTNMRQKPYLILKWRIKHKKTHNMSNLEKVGFE